MGTHLWNGRKKRNGPDGRSNEDEEQKGKFPKDLPMTLLHLLKEKKTKKRVSMDSRHLNEQTQSGVILKGWI